MYAVKSNIQESESKINDIRKNLLDFQNYLFQIEILFVFERCR